jgi:transposase
MDAIFFVLRTGSQWGALSATGICSKSSAHRRFTEWVEAGVFHEFWRLGLLSWGSKPKTAKFLKAFRFKGLRYPAWSFLPVSRPRSR